MSEESSIRRRVLLRLQHVLHDFYENPYRTPLRPSSKFDAPDVDFEHGAEPAAVFDHVVASLDRGILHTTHPGYFGYFNPSATFMSVIADALAAVYNPQLGATAHAPAAVEMERRVLTFFAERLGFADQASGAIFTSGGAESNQTALLCALFKAFPECRTVGARNIKVPRMYISAQAHHSFIKAARVAGIGDDAVRSVPVDANQAISITALRHMIEDDVRADNMPFFIVATYGTTNSGAIDDVRAVHDVSATTGCWLHVDAAWGGAFAALVPEVRSKAWFAGADSVCLDAHKALSVPMAAGMLFMRRDSDLSGAFSVEAEYMPHGGTHPDYYLRSMQWSRRFIGLKLYMALATWGAQGYCEMLEHQIALCNSLRQGLIADEWTIETRSPLPIVCFTLNGRSETDLRDIARKVNRSSVAWLGLTTLNNTNVLRACVCNYRSTQRDVDALLLTLREAREAL